tara:strand:+ start:496 stop:1761 length:1266 start_codon:yes stop_codon:yes gene_type:complete
MLITEVIQRRTWQQVLAEATGDKNTHLEHLEDLILNNGYDGAISALNYVNALRGMLYTGGEAQSKVTVKWDGAPAIICGIDPVDSKFFVGTKAVFGKTEQKAAKTNAEIDNWYPGEGLNKKLKLALQHLSKIGIKNVLQGDMMFTDDSIEEKEIGGEAHLTFTPNTITYAVPKESDLGNKIGRAKIGIVFHTTYKGETLTDLKAEFGASVGGFQESMDVWFDDAYYKDVGGKATLTKQENAVIIDGINKSKTTLGKVDKERFNSFLTQPDLAEWVKPFINKKITAGQSVGEPVQFVKDFVAYFKERMDKEIDALKGGPESPAAKKRIERNLKLEQFVDDNLNNLLAVMAVYKQVIQLKLKLLKKLELIEQNVGTFLKTDKGYKVTNPEGFVAFGIEGGAVKLNDRLEFNQANFNAVKNWSK